MKSQSRTMLLFAALLLIAAFSAFSAPSVTRAQEVESHIVIYSDAGGEQIQLDVYQPPPRDLPRPAVVVIHGGAGSYGARGDLKDHAQALAAAGYVTFNINYRLLRGERINRWPAQLDDAQLAVRWVRANAATYNVDPERICSLGHSFGGQLAALLGVRDTPADGDLPLAEYSSHVACVVDIAGSVDPTQLMVDTSIQPDVTRLFGGTVEEVPERYRDASPLAFVDADSAPFLIFHGANDENISVEESRRMVDALHKAGVAVVYVEYPLIRHFDWIIPGDGWDMVSLETLAFLERNLHPAT